MEINQTKYPVQTVCINSRLLEKPEYGNRDIWSMLYVIDHKVWLKMSWVCPGGGGHSHT